MRRIIKITKVIGLTTLMFSLLCFTVKASSNLITIELDGSTKFLRSFPLGTNTTGYVSVKVNNTDPYHQIGYEIYPITNDGPKQSLGGGVVNPGEATSDRINVDLNDRYYLEITCLPTKAAPTPNCTGVGRISNYSF